MASACTSLDVYMCLERSMKLIHLYYFLRFKVSKWRVKKSYPKYGIDKLADYLPLFVHLSQCNPWSYISGSGRDNTKITESSSTYSS